MEYTTREIVIFAASAVAILASLVNILQGASGTGLWVSSFVIVMFLIVIVATARKA